MQMLLTPWEPDNRLFWEREGSRIARRNLALSIPPLVLSFAVWMVWSAVVVYLPHVGFRFTANQLFWLAALPGLAGGTLRLFFAFLVPVVGGRLWTALSTVLLIVPCLGLALAVQDPGTVYPVFLVLALAAGIGGGNFASSMANLSFFYPTARKGAALGLNAGLGNLGVALVQLAVPLAIGGALFGALGGAPQVWTDGGDSREIWLQNAGLVWVPFILVAAAAAWYGMDDVAEARGRLADQAVVFVRRHTWILAWLYLGTFGSFIGFAAGLPLLADTAFGAADVVAYAFLGPLVAALTRPVGGWIADRVGGARVVLASFVVLALAAGALLVVLPAERAGGHYAGFLAVVLVLFAASGAGNGALYQMIPVVFVRACTQAAGDRAESKRAAVREGNLEAAAAIGFTSAIAAFGGFFIPKSLGTAISLTGAAAPAIYLFIAFYASCAALAWWHYARRGTPFAC